MANTALGPISARPRRVMTTAAQRAEILRKYAGSGLGPREFAHRIGVPEGTFISWVSDARAEAAQGAPSPKDTGKVRVQVFTPAASSVGPFELQLSGGLILRVPAGFDGPELRRLLNVLDGAC